MTYLNFEKFHPKKVRKTKKHYKQTRGELRNMKRNYR